ncbi:hypothetical protein BK004_04055 [bacterium CG10_46_32]|nr:MAG: hypothetical protein BK004_04055 [bacterium CG10_46_32]PIR55792.1 MAG: hypothetical protein COU73_04095 [Parcubacteria group bacterium CG10_big_fil_rev_8_21_14_0_10_46_32]
MNIAIVSAVFPPYRGGIGAVAQAHARMLALKGQNISMFTPNYGQGAYVGDASYKIELLQPKLKYGNAAWVPQLESQLKDFDAVILQYPFFGGMRAVYNAKKKYGFKLILNYNMDVVGSGLKGLVFWYATKFFLPRIVKIADVVLASSEDYARHSDLGRLWSNDKKFQVVPIGVDLNKFKPDPSARLRLGRDDKGMVLFVGGLDRAHYFKGVEYLIKAMPLVSMDAKFVIAGKGDRMEQYEKQAQNLGVADRVTFAGGVSDEELVALYQNAAVTVLPSIDQSESFGIVLAESMACGTPVITSNLPGVRSVYQDGVSGITIPVRDEKALANAINFIVTNPSKHAAMGKSARKLCETRYTGESIGNTLLTLCGVQ